MKNTHGRAKETRETSNQPVSCIFSSFPGKEMSFFAKVPTVLSLHLSDWEELGMSLHSGRDYK